MAASPQLSITTKMNIFVLDENPIKAAHLVPIKVASKMALEAVQMLAVACARYGLALPHKKDGNEYSSKSHVNHPCTKWVCESYENMLWLCLHGVTLLCKHEENYGKMPAHLKALQEVAAQIGVVDFFNHTPFVSVMPDEFKTEDVVESYRAYIKTKPYYVAE
jgi:hypothetical protein